jgi:hypothetical protein
MLLRRAALGSPLHRQLIRIVGLSVGLALAFADWSGAQQITGTLYGKVTTEDGAALPGATVSVKSPRLIKAEEVRVTNGSGQYSVPNLPSGTYSVQVVLQGFTSQRHENVELVAGASIGVDFQLTVASLQETVVVVAEAPLVDVKTSQVTQTVGAMVIEHAPVARRSAGQLLNSLPGVYNLEGGAFENSSVHGGGPQANLQQIDGAAANDPSDGSFMLEPPIDMLESVQVTTGGLAAEYGNASAAVFNYVTKSGGNSFKGGLSSYYSNNHLQSDNLDDELRAVIPQGSTVPKNLEYGGYLGGPIRKDRVWFFANIRHLEESSRRPEFTARDQEKSQNQWFVKLTAQATKKLRLQASITHRYQSNFPDLNSFQFNVDPKTWVESSRSNAVYNVSATQVLSDSTFLEAQFSRTRWQLDRIFPLGDFPGYQDVVTQLYYNGWNRDYGSYFDRDQQVAKASLTHHLGHHQIKAGLEWGYTPFYRETLRPENFFGLYQNLKPYRVQLYNTPLDDKSNYERKAAYVQDQWTLGRLTLNLGLRAESAVGWLPEQCSGGANTAFPTRTCFPEVRDVPDWNYVTPRIGLVWAVDKSNKTAVKASIGRYYQPITVGIPEGANKNAQSSREYDWIDSNGDNLFQYGEQGTLRATRLASQNFVDPDLGQPYVNTLYVGFVTVGVTGIYKKKQNIIDQISTNRPLAAYNAVSVNNPFTGEPLTVYALKPQFASTTSILETTNVGELYEEYKGIEITANKRMANHWQLQGSLNFSRLRGNTGGSFADPNGRVFVEGPLDIDSPVMAKVMGSYEAPWGFRISGQYLGQAGLPSPIPTTTTAGVPGASRVRFNSASNPAIVVESFIEVRAEPRGSQRLPYRNLFSVQVEKEFKLPGGTRLSAVLDVINLFNDNTVTGVQALLYNTSNYLAPALIVNPRTLRLGAKFDF